MKSIKNHITNVLLTCYLFIGSTFADTLSDTNRLLNWAEAKYPQLFSPAGQTTQQWNEWFYRYYPSTQNYAGVNINDLGAYVRGEDFGGLRYKGKLDELLAFMDKNPADSVGKGSGGCVDLPLIASGTGAVWRINDSETHERIYTEVNGTFSKQTGTYNTSTYQLDQTYHLDNGKWYRDSVNYQDTVVDSLTTYNSPGLVDSLKTPCQGDTWDSGVVRYTNTDSAGTVTGTGTEQIQGTVEAVNEQITTPLGTFNTVRLHLIKDNTVTTNITFNGENINHTETTESEEIEWIDINTGLHVRLEVPNKNGTYREELISIF